MMYYLNKFAFWCVHPAVITIFLLAVAAIAVSRGRRRLAYAAGILAALVTWFFSTPFAAALLGLPLERPYLKYQDPASLPEAGAIVVLGGGMWAGDAEDLLYPDMGDGADRVWHAARLYHAGKAPLVIASGSLDDRSTVPLLLQLGVPPEAILVDKESRNTYENSRFTERLLRERNPEGRELPSVLLVTSAWHMRRALGNFSQTSLKVYPAPADFKAHVIAGGDFELDALVPGATMDVTAILCFYKEWIGRLARK